MVMVNVKLKNGELDFVKFCMLLARRTYFQWISTTVWPKVIQGTHLTVKTFKDGRTELVWDDEALAREVKEATEAYELSQLKPAVRAKAATRKKKAQ